MPSNGIRESNARIPVLRQHEGLAGRRQTLLPRISLADTRRAYISVTDDEYGALLRHVYKFWCRASCGFWQIR
jgi:hypothetical protein